MFSLKNLINNGLAQPQAAPKRGQLDLGDLLQDLDGQNPPPLFCTVTGECTSAQVTAGSPLLQVHALQPICHLLSPCQVNLAASDATQANRNQANGSFALDFHLR